MCVQQSAAILVIIEIIDSRISNRFQSPRLVSKKHFLMFCSRASEFCSKVSKKYKKDPKKKYS